MASEVKSLATQAARSTETISKEIANMQTVTTEVVDALGIITSNITAVLDNVSGVASAMEQQKAVSSEISGNMHAAVPGDGQNKSWIIMFLPETITI